MMCKGLSIICFIILIFPLGSVSIFASEAIIFSDERSLIVQEHEELEGVYLLKLDGGGMMSCEKGMVKEIRFVEDQPDEAVERSLAAPVPGQKPDYEAIIEEVSREHDVDSSLVKAVVKIESNFNPFSVSPKGAQGLMQLMPKTATRFNVDNVFDPKENIQGGIRYLKFLSNRYGRRLDLILAAYNAGEEAVEKHGGVPPYRETIEYVLKVLRLYNKS
ncbi:MAG: lytic transglycosylase domain-containing protein [Acidobacteriota bacterium]